MPQYPQWKKALRLYAKARRNMTEPEIINRAGGQSCINAIRLTPKASLGKFPLNATTDPDKGGRTYKQRFYYAEAATQGNRRGDGIKSAAKKLRNRRRSAKGAIAAGFIEPAKTLGRNLRARSYKNKRAGSSVSRSYGIRAKPGRSRKFRALAVNLVDGAGKVARPAMEAALLVTALDMQRWAIAQLQKADNKFSARRH